jgi:hypothetical protein
MVFLHCLRYLLWKIRFHFTLLDSHVTIPNGLPAGNNLENHAQARYVAAIASSVIFCE